ncbi:MAG: hypothetical protein CMH57_11815 [Myxococcales bacterium]|nr:hypothetical protein [Myxococcales bacterium]
METQDELIRYLLGDLDGPDLDRLEARLKRDPALTRELGALEDALCAMSEALDPMEPAPESRSRLLGALEPGARFEPWVGRLTRMLDLAEEAVRGLLASLDAPDAPWEPGPCEGAALIHLPTGPRFAGALAGFIRVEPGVRFPHHKHAGREVVLVIQGGLLDSSGAVLRAGDESVMGEETEHDFVALEGPPLIYVVTLAEMVEFSAL